MSRWRPFVSRSGLVELDRLARRYPAKTPSGYAGVTDPVHAFWIDQAAWYAAAEARPPPEPPADSPIARFRSSFGRRS